MRKTSKYQGVFYRERKAEHNGRPDKTWEYCWNRDGKKTWTTVGRASEGATAELAHEARMEAIISHRRAAKAGPLIGDLIEPHLQDHGRLRSEAARRIRLSMVNTHIRPLSGMRVGDVDRPFLLAWTASLAARLAVGTVVILISTLRRVIQAGIDRGLAEGPNPVRDLPRLPPPVKCERFLEGWEAPALLAALRRRSPDLADMAELSLETGIRKVELYRLRSADVAADGLTAMVDGKSGKREALHLTPRALEIIRGRPAEGQAFPARVRDRVFKAAVRDAGIDPGADVRSRVRFHTLRHTFASRLVQRGVDLYAVQRLMRHASPAMTARYAHLRPSDLRAALIP
jgi:integrase